MQVIYATSILAYAFVPILAFVTKGEFELLLYVFIPGSDSKQPIGYMINLAYQVMVVFFGLVGTIASDLYCFTVVIHIRPIQQIFKNSIIELNETLTKSPFSEMALVKLKLRNILLMHKDIYKYEYREKESNSFGYIWNIFYIYSYTRDVKINFYSTCIGELYATSLGIIACIYSILTVYK